MALDQSALLELSAALQSADAGELMRTLLTTIVQALVEAEASAHVGADRHERTEARTTQRNGHRPKTWSQNLRACRSSRSTRPWLIVSVHVDAGFFPAAATGR